MIRYYETKLLIREYVIALPKWRTTKSKHLYREIITKLRKQHRKYITSAYLKSIGATWIPRFAEVPSYLLEKS